MQSQVLDSAILRRLARQIVNALNGLILRYLHDIRKIIVHVVLKKKMNNICTVSLEDSWGKIVFCMIIRDEEYPVVFRNTLVMQDLSAFNMRKLLF